MIEVVLKKKDHTKIKKILICIIIFSSLVIVGLSYLLYLHIKKQPLIEYPVYTVSTTDWTATNVIISVSNEDSKISEYSFDGGVNFQESNEYEVIENGEFVLVVRDINGKLSKVIPLSIRNIDKESPNIVFEGITTVQLGSSFSVRNGVQATDLDSGLNSNYVAVPDSIDTSVEGEYVIKYTAFDKVGNYTEKERKIIVRDIKGRTYYRYRTAKVEDYLCEPYSCNCVVSESAKLNKSCPTGYIFNGTDKCCQTCHKTCRKINWSEWSEWSQKKVLANTTTEVETKIE